MMDNDTRGWIMACISGAACILGASVICVDLLVRRIPRWKNFKVQDSNGFLAASLSLSAGVMLYSALYSMLPSSKKSLVDGGLSPSAAAYTMIGCFLGGVIGIRLLSRFMHRFLPSHVVDCDHAHKHEGGVEDAESCQELDDDIEDQRFSEDRPLLSRDDYDDSPVKQQRSGSAHPEVQQRPDAPLLAARNASKLSLPSQFAQRMTSFMSNSKELCDEGGPCFGYSDPCGNECYRVISRPAPNQAANGALPNGRLELASPRTEAHAHFHAAPGQLEDVSDEGLRDSETLAGGAVDYGSCRGWEGGNARSPSADSHSHGGRQHSHSKGSGAGGHHQHHHHHHVASNAFLSIGLQTSIAIALHKLPEGFITYATNHANPKLGTAIFMALFIHNITEGFALALPLYLALDSRIKAMFWASLLGGASQPLGAGIAELWFRVAKSRDMVPSESVYGVMFAITSGIMTNVALQLFAESLGLTHNKSLCIAMAFVGMGILGFSNALTA